MSAEKSPPEGESSGLSKGFSTQIKYALRNAEIPGNMPAAAVVAELQRYASSVGLSLTARCMRCGAPLWAPQSLNAKLGPKCRRLRSGA